MILTKAKIKTTEKKEFVSPVNPLYNVWVNY